MRRPALSTCIIALCLTFAAPAAAQNSPGPVRGSAYALGVHMAFASFALTEWNQLRRSGLTGQVSGAVTQSTPNVDVSRIRWCDRAKRELGSTLSYIAGLNAYLGTAHSDARLAPPDLGASAEDSCPSPDYVVNLRTAYSGALSRGAPDAANAYNLGVNLGIAEIQATVGEPARPIVVAALSNARLQVNALGLTAQPLEEAFSLATQGGAMRLVYEKIVTARSAYQSAL